MLSEKDFEGIICKYPDLIEGDLVLKGRQLTIYGRRIDILFEDKYKRKLLIELKVGPIKDEHIGQILSYEGMFISADDPSIRVMLVGNRVPPNIRRSLDHHGIGWKEIAISKIKEYLTAKNDNELLELLQDDVAPIYSERIESLKTDESKSRTIEKADEFQNKEPVSIDYIKEIDVETDKLINVYALAEGRQILLCKNEKPFQKIVLIWSAWYDASLTSDKNKYEVFIRNKPEAASRTFLLSDIGNKYMACIPRNFENQYIAQVNYLRIDGNDYNLWKALYDAGEFSLWDIKDGPMKYFKNKRDHYLAIYRVYRISNVIEKGAGLDFSTYSAYYKTLNTNGIKKINESKKWPVIDNEIFNKRVDNIVKIVNAA